MQLEYHCFATVGSLMNQCPWLSRSWHSKKRATAPPGGRLPHCLWSSLAKQKIELESDEVSQSNHSFKGNIRERGTPYMTPKWSIQTNLDCRNFRHATQFLKQKYMEGKEREREPIDYEKQLNKKTNSPI